MAVVLVVDDIAANRDYVATVLRHLGHDVCEAGDGLEALELAQSAPPDLVITDLLMPHMDGYEFVRQLREIPRLASTRVVFYTAQYLVDEARPFADAAGVTRVLPKPAEPQELIDVVAAELADAAPPVSPDAGKLDRAQAQALGAKLMQKVNELEATRLALERSESRFRALAEAAPIGIVSISDALRVTYANPRMRDLSQLPVDQMLTGDELHPDDRDEFRRAAGAALRARAQFAQRARLLRADGTVRFADFIVAPVPDPAPDAAFVGVAVDVTDAIDAEERLRASERLESLGQLAAGVAHDFNNILGAILNYAQFVESAVDRLAAHTVDPALDQMRDDVATITRAAERAADLTHQLLLFGRGQRLEVARVDLNQAVGEAEKLLARTLPSNIRVITTLGGDVPPVMADGGQLSQVILNLAINARDAIEDHGSILISTGRVHLDAESLAAVPDARPGAYCVLSVSDDGTGMDAKTLARAFEPFFTTKPKDKGTGLGLATVYGVIRQLGGFTDVQSVEGVGTTFQVYLPAADPTSPASVDDLADGDPLGHGETILLVDDDDDTRAATRRILTEGGYTVLAEARAAAAVTTLDARAKEVALVLTDIVMPDVSGRALAATIAERWPHIPVLLMSGYAPAGEDDAGGEPVLAKPLLRSPLLGAVARRLRMHDA